MELSDATFDDGLDFLLANLPLEEVPRSSDSHGWIVDSNENEEGTPKVFLELGTAVASTSATLQEEAASTNPASEQTFEVPGPATAQSSTDVVLKQRRKRKAEKEWKQNVRKRQRNLGEKYANTKDRIVLERAVGPPCSCKKKCIEIVGEEERLKLFKEFWSLGCFEKQNCFIAACVSRKDTPRSRVPDYNTRRNFTLDYKFNSKTVCKVFFLQTLNITERRIRTVLDKKSGNVTPSRDQRGQHDNRPRKISLDRINLMNEHIDSFPRVPAHWCRANTKKEYLEASLTKATLYKLYRELCSERKVTPVGKTFYMEQLIKKNIGFFTPKKDSCWCVFFHELSADEQEAKKQKYEIHVKNKDLAKSEKGKDKKIALADPTYFAGNFDLQAVLYSPLFLGKPLFYKRKLATFNFTIFDTANKKGYCYVWQETEGKRGGLEIGSCLYRFLNDLPGNYKEITLFSDSCPGQNRNNLVAKAFLAFMNNSSSNESRPDAINLKFLESGHTNMECDSMHATIENSSKVAKICVPDDWLNVIRMAKKSGLPYSVNKLTHDDFINLNNLRSVFPNITFTESEEKVPWSKIKWLRFEKQSPKKFLFKLAMDRPFHTVDTSQVRSSRQKSTPIEIADLKSPYSAQLPISKAKYDDLIALCNAGIIPNSYHDFYKKLPFETVIEDDDLPLSTLREKLKKKRIKAH